MIQEKRKREKQNLIKTAVIWLRSVCVTQARAMAPPYSYKQGREPDVHASGLLFLWTAVCPLKRIFKNANLSTDCRLLWKWKRDSFQKSACWWLSLSLVRRHLENVRARATSWRHPSQASSGTCKKVSRASPPSSCIASARYSILQRLRQWLRALAQLVLLVAGIFFSFLFFLEICWAGVGRRKKQ